VLGGNPSDATGTLVESCNEFVVALNCVLHTHRFNAFSCFFQKRFTVARRGARLESTFSRVETERVPSGQDFTWAFFRKILSLQKMETMSVLLTSQPSTALTNFAHEQSDWWMDGPTN
jgi:hypothetical protein